MTSSFTSIHFPATATEVAEYDAFLDEINAASAADQDEAEYLDRLAAAREYKDRWCQC